MNDSFQAVIFDMDGTLLDTEKLSREAWRRAEEGLGYSMPDSLYARLIGRTMEDARLILAEGLPPEVPLERFIAHASAEYIQMVREVPSLVKPGVNSVLEWIRRSQLPVAVATSTEKELALRKLESSGLLSFFHHVVGGDEVERGKPAPDIFLRTASLLNCSPSRCVVVEDSENGVRAAHAAGMRVLWVPDLLDPPEESRGLAHAVLTNMESVLEWLQEERAERAKSSPSGTFVPGEKVSGDQSRLLWEKNAEAWTHLARSGYDVCRDAYNLPGFLALLPSVSGLTGLDVGCGEGETTRRIARLGAKLDAIDQSSVFIRQARLEEDRAPLGIHFQQAMAESLPYADKSFDFVISTMCLMDMPCQEAALREIHRVLRPGGFFQFSITHPCTSMKTRFWLKDEKGNKMALAQAGYFEPPWGEVEEWVFGHAPETEKARFPKFRIPRYQRTLSGWLNLVLGSGFLLEAFSEPRPDAEALRRYPKEVDAAMVPFFLIIRTRKPGILNADALVASTPL